MTPWLAYVPTHREFEAAQAAADLGIVCHIAKRVDAKRQGKRRYAEAVVSPLWPNYIFLELTDPQWHQINAIPGLRLTMMGIGQTEWRVLLRALATIAADFNARMAQIEAGQRVSEYTAGDLLQIVGGPFADRVATFRRIVEASPFPMIEAETDMMGRSVRVTVDPLMARMA